MFNIIVYGSLRKGDGNYDAYKNYYGKDFEYKQTTEIQGYELYSLYGGAYPGIKKGQPSDKLTVDIIRCSNECFADVTSMEEGAGYKTVPLSIEGVNGEVIDGFIYEYEGHVKEENLVESGNWINHKYPQYAETE